VTVTPASSTACVGQTTQLVPVLRDAAGNILTGRAITYTSSNPLIASVNSGGLVSALAGGTATITVAAEGKSATANVNVCLNAAAAVVLAPATASIAVGATSTLSATVTDALGNVITGRPIVYTSSSPLVASVAANGTVLGLLPGTTTITATVDGKIATSLITVTP